MQAGQIVPVSRMIELDADGKNVRTLNQSDRADQRYGNLYGGGILDLQPGDEGTVLMDRWFVPEVTGTTRLNNKKEGFGVIRVETRSLSTKIVEQPLRYAVEYISDGRGQVRIMGVQLPKGASGYSGDKIRYSYRSAQSSRWQPLGEYDVLTYDGLNPYAVDAKLNVAYAMKKVNGRQALFRIALDGSMREELVYAHPHVDVDDVVRIGRSRRPVGVSVVTDKREAVYFDAELKQLSASLARSMPKLPLIRFVDSSADEQKLLIWAGSDTDPGRYFVYDKAKRQLSEIMLARPQLEGMTLACQGG